MGARPKSRSDGAGGSQPNSSISLFCSLAKGLHDPAGSSSSTTEGDECVSTHRRWWCQASLTAGGDRCSRRGPGSDGASRHGQTHSSCPRATTRLITAERRVDTVDLKKLSLYRCCRPSRVVCARSDKCKIKSDSSLRKTVYGVVSRPTDAQWCGPPGPAKRKE